MAFAPEKSPSDTRYISDLLKMIYLQIKILPKLGVDSMMLVFKQLVIAHSMIATALVAEFAAMVLTEVEIIDDNVVSHSHHRRDKESSSRRRKG